MTRVYVCVTFIVFDIFSTSSFKKGHHGKTNATRQFVSANHTIKSPSAKTTVIPGGTLA